MKRKIYFCNGLFTFEGSFFTKNHFYTTMYTKVIKEKERNMLTKTSSVKTTFSGVDFSKYSSKVSEFVNEF